MTWIGIMTWVNTSGHYMKWNPLNLKSNGLHKDGQVYLSAMPTNCTIILLSRFEYRSNWRYLIVLGEYNVLVHGLLSYHVSTRCCSVTWWMGMFLCMVSVTNMFRSSMLFWRRASHPWNGNESYRIDFGNMVSRIQPATPLRHAGHGRDEKKINYGIPPQGKYPDIDRPTNFNTDFTNINTHISIAFESIFFTIAFLVEGPIPLVWMMATYYSSKFAMGSVTVPSLSTFLFWNTHLLKRIVDIHDVMPYDHENGPFDK